MPEDQQGQSVTSSHSNQQRFFTNIYTYILDLAHAAAVAVLAAVVDLLPLPPQYRWLLLVLFYFGSLLPRHLLLQPLHLLPNQSNCDRADKKIQGNFERQLDVNI